MKSQIPLCKFTIAVSDLERLRLSDVEPSRFNMYGPGVSFGGFSRGLFFEGTFPTAGDRVMFVNHCPCWGMKLKDLKEEILKEQDGGNITFTFLRADTGFSFPSNPHRTSVPSSSFAGAKLTDRDGYVSCMVETTAGDIFFGFQPENEGRLVYINEEKITGLSAQRLHDVIHKAANNANSLEFTFLPEDPVSMFSSLPRAIDFGLVPIVKRFFEEKHRSVDDWIDRDGNTALHLATKNLQNGGLLEYLLTHLGADPIICNKHGKLPIDTLYEAHHVGIGNDPRFKKMSLLLLHGKRREIGTPKKSLWI